MTQKLVSSVSVLSLLLALNAPLSVPASAAAQGIGSGTPEPRREQLLNGLKLLLLPRQGDTEVFLKLRIKSGAAFDLAGKEGVMALLGDALFPDPATRQYVTEELGGRLEVTTGYDSIDITLSGHAAEFERLVELLRNALVNTQLSPEGIARLREARLKAVRDVSVAPTTVADRAISTRLFGTFPYGRIIAGSPESLARIDRADLILVRQRFLNPNNATLAVVGGVEAPRALRALRQFLGVWRKSDVDVPSTFRQPPAPDARTLVVDMAGVPDAEVRLAVRGLAWADKDTVAARLLGHIVRARWQKNFPELKGRPSFAGHEAYTLPGVFRMGASLPSNLAAQAIQTGRAAMLSLASTPPTADELEAARRELVAVVNARAGSVEALADGWLEQDLYGTNPADALRAIDRLTPADVQRVAARLFSNAPVAAIVTGDAAQLRTELARTGEIEVLGATGGSTPAPQPAATPTPGKIIIPVKRP